MKIKQFIIDSLLPLLLIFILCSCNGNNKKFQFTEHVASFSIGFPGFFMPCQANQKDSEYVAFVNLTTFKKISVFSVNGNHLYDVSIDRLIKKEKKDFYFGGFANLGSFILISKYTNQVYLIDKNARIIAKKDYSRYLLDGYELFPNAYFKNGFFQTAVMYNGINFPSNPSTRDVIDYYKKNYSKPKWFMDKFFLNSSNFSHVSFVVDSFYTRFLEQNQLASEGRCETNLEKTHLFYSGYTDTVYIYDNEDYALTKAIKVKSNYASKIGAIPTTFEEGHKDVDLINRRIRNSAFIYRVYYDRYRSLYYCFVRQPMKGDLLPFSIIVYDTKFNKLDEILMNETKYLPNAFVGVKGLYVLNKDNETENQYFSIFSYE